MSTLLSDNSPGRRLGSERNKSFVATTSVKRAIETSLSRPEVK